MAQTDEFMFSNVAYIATVHRNGMFKVLGIYNFEEKGENVIKPRKVE